jgi:hypothetical protein
MPRDNDAEYNKLETELAKLKADAKGARANADSEEDREEIDNTVKVATRKQREIKGASESSVHAALEEIRALRSELSDKYNILPSQPKPTPTVQPKPGISATSTETVEKEWSIADLFF